MLRFKKLLAGLLVGLFASVILHAATIGELRCEDLNNPSGIDAPQPRLSWMLHSSGRNQAQSAYQILVASSPKELAANAGGLWDSGKVASDESIQIPYAGKAADIARNLFLESSDLGPKRKSF